LSAHAIPDGHRPVEEPRQYADLAERLKVSPEAARAIAKRLRLPRSWSNAGKALVSVDLAEIQHNALPGRSPGGRPAVTAPLTAGIETQLLEVARLRGSGGRPPDGLRTGARPS
jgi:hypothetical protein